MEPFGFFGTSRLSCKDWSKSFQSNSFLALSKDRSIDTLMEAIKPVVTVKTELEYRYKTKLRAPFRIFGKTEIRMKLSKEKIFLINPALLV